MSLVVLMLTLGCSPSPVVGGADAVAGVGDAEACAEVATEVAAETLLDVVTEVASLDTDAHAEVPAELGDAEGELDAADVKPEATIETAVDSDAKPEVAAEIASDATPACYAKPPQATALPNDCSPQCQAPYPCYCQTCPWLPTPKMNVARAMHAAVWTGKYVVIAGNATGSSQQLHLTGERWDLATNYWEPIDLGPQVVVPSLGAVPTNVAWTGKEVVVMPGGMPWLRYDPATNSSKKVAALAGQDQPGAGVLGVWVGGRIATGYWSAPEGVALYDPETDNWTTTTPPSALLPPVAKPGIVAYCYGGFGDDLYVFAPKLKAVPDGLWPNGADQNKVERVTMKLHVPTLSWSLVGGKVPKGMHCDSPAYAQVVPSAGVITVFSPFPAHAATRFDLASQTWLDPVPFPVVLGGSMQLYQLAGTRIWSAGWLTNGAEYTEVPTMTKYRPGPMAFDIASGNWLLTTVHGQPKDDRGSIAMALTETEVIFLGGQDGPGFPVVHNDGYRLPLSAAGKKGVIP